MSENLKYCGECGAANSAKNDLCDECGCAFRILDPKVQVAITEPGPVVNSPLKITPATSDIELLPKQQLERKLFDLLQKGGKLDVACGDISIFFIKNKATDDLEVDLGAFDEEDEGIVSQLEAIGYQKVNGRLKKRFSGSIMEGDIHNIVQEVDTIFRTIFSIPRVEKYKIKEHYNYKLSRKKIVIFILILATWVCVYNAVTKRETGESARVIQPASQPVAGTIGEQITVGNFIYKVNNVQLTKSIPAEFLSATANGLYLIIDLSIKNISSETRLIDNGLFKLTDKNNNQFETSIEGGSALEMDGANSLYLKQSKPGIQTEGFLVFEVPEKKKSYELHLSGGPGNGKTAKISIN